MAAVNAQAVALRMPKKRSGKSTRPENMSRIPLIRPKAISASLENGMPKPTALACGLTINIIPIKIIPTAISSVIQKDADRAPHLLFSIIGFICSYLFNGTKFSNENSRFIHPG
jgi:hypothetical protein